MNFKIHKASDKMLAVKADLYGENANLSKLNCGQSIHIPRDQASETMVRNLMRRHKVIDKEYKLVKHKDFYEIGRIK